MKDIYIDVPSPFGLSRPSLAWCGVLAEYDPELRLYPSQTQPVFRLARRAHHTPVIRDTIERMRKALASGQLTEVHPDTKIALAHRLVAVCALRGEVVNADPTRVVEKLRLRDQWAFKDGDAVADALDQRDDAEARAVHQAQRAATRDRRLGMKVAYRYRTGARVSLVSPRRHEAAVASAPAPSNLGSAPAQE